METGLLFAGVGAIAVVAIRLYAKVHDLPLAKAEADLWRSFLCFVATAIVPFLAVIGAVPTITASQPGAGIVALIGLLALAWLALCVGAFRFLWRATSALVVAPRRAAIPARERLPVAPVPRIDPETVLTRCPACDADFAPTSRCPECGLNFAQ
jgi:hypothetical protein